jgi:hypothetical protein
MKTLILPIEVLRVIVKTQKRVDFSYILKKFYSSFFFKFYFLIKFFNYQSKVIFK